MRRLFAFIVLLNIAFCGITAQTVTIDVPNQSKLKKYINKKDYEKITDLKITGYLTEIDYELFPLLTNLTTLDLSLDRCNWEYHIVVYPQGTKVDRCVTVMSTIDLTGATVPLSLVKQTGGGRCELINNSEHTIHIKELDAAGCDEIIVEGKFLIEKVKMNEINGYVKELPKLLFNEIEFAYNDKSASNKGGYKYDDDDYYKYRVSYSTQTFEQVLLQKEENCNTLVIPAIARGTDKKLSLIEPVFMVVKGESSVKLVNYIGSDSNVKVAELGCSYGHVDEVEPLAFRNHPEVTSIDLTGIEKINAYTFYGTSVKTVNIPSSVKEIHPLAFEGSSVKEVVFESKYAPVIINIDEWQNKDHFYEPPYLQKYMFTIPNGSRERFQIGIWKKLPVYEAGTTSDVVLTCTKPGTLDSHVGNIDTLNIKTLTVKGFLDDTDFKTIKKFKNLKSLDMSKCHVIKSKATLEAERADAEFLIALIGTVAKGAALEAQAKYNNGRGSATQVAYTNAMAEDYDARLNEYLKNRKPIEADNNCVLPSDALHGLEYLEEFSYPLQAINADVSMPKSINRVSFPASPKTLGGFGRCEIDTLIIPASIEKIENRTFYESKIGFLDMSMCGIVEICGNKLYDEIFKDVEIGTFKAPKRATRVPLSLSRVKEAFFYTLEWPECLDLSYTTGIIHIPRGSKAGWGANEHIIDDIEE